MSVVSLAVPMFVLFVLFVALVAEVALVAFPDKAPVNVVVDKLFVAALYVRPLASVKTELFPVAVALNKT